VFVAHAPGGLGAHGAAQIREGRRRRLAVFVAHAPGTLGAHGAAQIREGRRRGLCYSEMR